jgi:Ca-activated chloride channel homolog
MYRDHANNRIVLCTDGVANEGNTGPESILQQVRTDADRGIYLSAIGFGMGNYNDVLLEQLADRGDGNYYYVDNLEEARRVFVENLTGTLQTVARDVKVQVEFDPTRVLRYRLLGYENRDVADQDFRNDRVDAGEVGAGHGVTALYELKLARGVRQGRIAAVRVRYARVERKSAGDSKAQEIEADFDASDLRSNIDRASPYLRLDAAAAEFAEILRGSFWARNHQIPGLLPLARDAAQNLNEPTAREFVSLAERAVGLSETLSPQERDDRTPPRDWERRQWEWRRERGDVR